MKSRVSWSRIHVRTMLINIFVVAVLAVFLMPQAGTAHLKCRL
jgi:hypothetical protein